MPSASIPRELISWNVNGVRAAMDKGLRDLVHDRMPDVLCLQETKARAEQVDTSWLKALGYHVHFHSAEKAGYSGTAVWSRVTPIDIETGIGVKKHDAEGRVMTVNFGEFDLVNVYTPNSQNELKRLAYRQLWDKAFLSFLRKRSRQRPVIVCGDLNCAHQEIDLARPKANRRSAGFTDEEREGLSRLLDAGWLDSFRQFDDQPDRYTWWSYRGGARQRNIGWRIDYFLVASSFWDAVESAEILANVMGSDHCPVSLILNG
ncbi:MAG: exodeoxyribonuclease III [Planctomycetota bacterium]